MRKKLKPDLDLSAIQQQVLDEVVNAYRRTGSVGKAAKDMDISFMKARKALITAGAYTCETYEEVERLRQEGKSIEEIAVLLMMSPASVSSYLPYRKIIYGLEERSVDADLMRRYRDRKRCREELKARIERGDDWRDVLWECIRLYQNYRFRAVGDGSAYGGAIFFRYCLPMSSKMGQESDEIRISTRKQDRTIRRGTVEQALERALAIQAKEGCISNPKKMGKIACGSYLYVIFLRWGVIRQARFPA